MLQFSDKAMQTIQQAMQSKTPTPQGLRLGVMGSPCSGLKYVIRFEASPNSDDEVIQCQGLPLFVDLDSVSKLQGVEVDFVDEGDRRGFTFSNPNFSSSCSGCSKATA